MSLQQKVVDARSRILGSYHADTLWSMNSLALVLKDLSRKDEARLRRVRALQGQILCLGKNHVHTKWTQEARQRLEEMENPHANDQHEYQSHLLMGSSASRLKPLS
jgi:hypothetical protein